MNFVTLIGGLRQLVSKVDFIDFANGPFRLRVSAPVLSADKTGEIAIAEDLTNLEKKLSMIGTAYHNTSAANAAAVITIAAPGAGLSLQLNQLTFSYSAAPTNGLLTIQQGATLIHETAITTAGAGPTIAGYKLTANTALTITLSAGGAGVIGRVSASIAVV